MAEKAKSLSEGERQALRRICDLLIPDSIDIKLEDVFSGYSKDRATKILMEAAEESPATTTLKMMAVQKILRECYGE